ncbi:MAG TPA: PqqD family peptide modification chaperone [Rhodothermales bacterium]|nr:PqqD family peptide modification chaperone [Rhodothermales bacterium]
MDITARSTIVASDALTTADFGEEAVILNLDSGKYFTVNEVGARILNIASRPIRVRDLVDRIRSEYDAPTEQLERDVLVFLEKMTRADLIRYVHETA